MYTFIKQWSNRGTTIYPGVSLIKGEFVVNGDTVSLKGSDTFKDIPLSSLKPYEETLPVTKKKK